MQPYQGDSAPVLDLYRLRHPGPEIGPYPAFYELQSWLEPSSSHSFDNIRIWVDASRVLVGYAVIHLPLCNLIFEVHPSVEGQVEAEMIAWAAGFIRHRNQIENLSDTLETLADADNLTRHDLLLANGFELLEGQTLRLLRSLDTPIPEPVFPPGYTVRACRSVLEDAADYAALHRDAFGSEYMTVENRLELMHEPGYDPDLDLVAVAPNGVWAAFVVCHWDSEALSPDGGRLAWTDPIGTRPAYRRLGLSRNLIAYGLQQLKGREATAAAVGTLSTNIAMLGVLESLGFRVIARWNWYAFNVARV